jgi:head-tail adaptor
MTRRKTSIARLRHRVKLCSQRDVVEKDHVLILNRTEVAELWADIQEKKSSSFTKKGAASGDNRSARTHLIKTRYRWDLDITNMAWLYEARLQSAPRWCKVLRVSQTEECGTQWAMWECRLVERTDDLVKPKAQSAMNPAVGLPDGVKL